MLLRATEIVGPSCNKSKQKAKTGERPCALVVSKSTSRKQAKAFAASHFNRPVIIFMVDTYAPVNQIVLGLHAPKHARSTNPAEQEIIIPRGVNWGKFEVINIITFFGQITLKGQKKPYDIFSVFGFSPDELPKLLELGIEAFPI